MADLPTPASRTEEYLNAIAENTAGGGGGGTSNFNQLTNRPKYLSETMTGDTNITTFSTGVAGVVPAPTSGDANKFLKGNGTWAEAGGGGGGGVTELSEADYNWNMVDHSATEPYDSIAAWLLEPGYYKVREAVDDQDSVWVASSSYNANNWAGHIVLVTGEDQMNGAVAICDLPSQIYDLMKIYRTHISDGANYGENEIPSTPIVLSMITNYISCGAKSTSTGPSPYSSANKGAIYAYYDDESNPTTVTFYLCVGRDETTGSTLWASINGLTGLQLTPYTPPSN